MKQPKPMPSEVIAAATVAARAADVRVFEMVKPVAALTSPPTVKAASGMQTFVERITPDQARELLKRNVSNRPIRRSWVKTLAALIERDEWVVTHQGIALSSGNELLDGQHRLLAIVKADKAVEMNVSYDCAPEAFRAIDSGVKRTTSDHLREQQTIVAVARLIWKLPAPSVKVVPSPPQIQEILSWCKPLIEQVVETAGARSVRSSAGVHMPLVIHLMRGKWEVLPKYRAFVLLDFDNMPPAVQNLHRQMVSKKATSSVSVWDVACRVWRTFDPENWGAQRIIVKGTDHMIAEMSRAAELFRRKALQKAAEKA